MMESKREVETSPKTAAFEMYIFLLLQRTLLRQYEQTMALPLPNSKPCSFLRDNHAPCTISIKQLIRGAVVIKGGLL